jgi:hypothetical protein
MSWVKGDRLLVTLEVIAEEPSDETGDIWFLEGIGRSYLNLPDIKLAGGEYTLEVMPNSVKLPTKKWASVLVNFWGKRFPVLLDDCGEWVDKSGNPVPESAIRRNYVLTLSEGVDE